MLLKNHYCQGRYGPLGVDFTAEQSYRLMYEKSVMTGQPKHFSTLPDFKSWVWKTRSGYLQEVMVSWIDVRPCGKDCTIGPGDKEMINRMIGLLDNDSRCPGLTMMRSPRDDYGAHSCYQCRASTCTHLQKIQLYAPWQSWRGNGSGPQPDISDEGGRTW